MKVEQIMVRKIEQISADSPVYEAVEKMIDKRLRALLVAPANGEDERGVITARDIVFKVIGKKLDLKKVKVRDICVKPLICINRDTDTDHVIALMSRHNVARVFVCDEGQIVGIVALLDVMNAALIDRARGDHGL